MRKILELWLYDLEISGKAQGTLKWYRRRITKFIEFTESTGTGINQKAILGFLSSLTCTDPTRAGYWRAIRAFVTWASNAERGYVANCLPGLKPRFKPAAPKIPPPPDHIDRLLKFMPKASKSQRRDHALFSFLYYTGVRVGEALQMKVKDVDLRQGQAVIYGRKTNSYRCVPLVDCLVRVLCSWVGHLKGEFLFPQFSRKYEDSPVSLNTIEKRWRDIQQRMQVDHINIHMLRHSFGTHSRMAGIDLSDIQQVMGHSSIQTTLIYAKTSNDALRKKFNQAFGDRS